MKTTLCQNFNKNKETIGISTRPRLKHPQCPKEKKQSKANYLALIRSFTQLYCIWHTQHRVRFEANTERLYTKARRTFNEMNTKRHAKRAHI